MSLIGTVILIGTAMLIQMWGLHSGCSCPQGPTHNGSVKGALNLSFPQLLLDCSLCIGLQQNQPINWNKSKMLRTTTSNFMSQTVLSFDYLHVDMLDCNTGCCSVVYSHTTVTARWMTRVVSHPPLSSRLKYINHYWIPRAFKPISFLPETYLS